MKHDMKYLELKRKHANEMHDYWVLELGTNTPWQNSDMENAYWKKINYWAGRAKMYTRLLNELKNHGKKSEVENGL